MRNVESGQLAASAVVNVERRLVHYYERLARIAAYYIVYDRDYCISSEQAVISDCSVAL